MADTNICKGDRNALGELRFTVNAGPVRAVDSFILERPTASLYHHSKWLDLIGEEFGHDTYTIYAERAETVVGVLPLVHLKSRLFGNYMVSLPYFNYGSAIAENDETECALMCEAASLAEEIGASHAEFRDVKTRELGWRERSDKVAMLRALPDDPDTLWSEIGAKRRSHIKRPLKEGAQLHVGGRELLREFYDVFSRNMRDLGTPVYPFSFFKAVADRFEPETVIISVRLHRQPVAAGFLLAHRDKLEIPWASSLREANRYGVNMLLYWGALKYAIESGARVFDFGRSTEASGTYKFKRQWGAEPHKLHWYYWLRKGNEPPRLSPDNPKFATAIAIWKRLPVVVTRLVGPHIVKNLP